MTRERGQALVLFSLYALLLTLMIVLLVSFGRRLHEKIELQTVADTAAYTGAVAGARTYNQLAVLNRVQIAHMVNIATINSVISMSTARVAAEVEADRGGWQVMLGQARAQIRQLRLLPPTPNNRRLLCGYLEIEAGLDALTTCPGTCCWGNGPSHRIVMGGPLDAAAGNQAQRRYVAAEGIYRQMRDALVDGPTSLAAAQASESLTADVAARSLPSSAVSAPRGPEPINERERRTLIHSGAPPCRSCSLTAQMDWQTTHLMIHLGTRDALSYRREEWFDQIGPDIANAANSLSHRCVPRMNFGVSASSSGGGSAYFGGGWHQPPAVIGTFRSDDEVSLSLNVSGGQPRGSPVCSAVMGTSTRTRFAFVASGRPSSSVHGYDGNLGGAGESALHTVLPGPTGVSDYPTFFDLDPAHVTDSPNLFAQPKTYAVVQRDYSSPLVTSLAFDFARFGSFDATGRRLRTGEDISHALALGTGLTYFHRPGLDRWREPPNLFAPFWRATLVAPTIDAQGRGDVRGVFANIANGVPPYTGDARAALSAEVVRELQRIGWEGF